MSRAIAFLAGLGAGHMDQKERNRQAARQDKADARDEENQAYLRSERERVAAERNALRAATADVPVVEEGGVKPPEMDNIDVGQPGEATVAPKVYRVGAKTFADRGVATEAAGTQRQANIDGALDRADPAGIAGRKAAKTSADLADVQLRTHVANMVKEGTLDALGAAMQGASPEEVKALFNRSGKSKVATLTVEPFEIDHPTMGKVKSARVMGTMEDGTPIQINDAFNQSLQLYGTAKRLGIEMDAQKRLDDKNDKLADNKRLDEAERRRGVHEDRMYATALRAANTAAAKAAGGVTNGGGPLVLTLKDKRDFESDLSGHIKDLYPIKDGADAAERSTMAAQSTAKKALANSLFQNNAQVGIPLTAATVLQAMELAGDRKNVRIASVGGVPHEAVVVNGQLVITSGPMQQRQAAAPPGPVAAPGATPLPGQTVIDPAIRAAEKESPGSWVRPVAAAGAVAQQPAASAPDKAAFMQPLNEAVAQASAQLAAVARSGDQQAIAKYGAAVEAARAARLKAAVQQFGQAQAAEYLATLPQ